MPEVVDATQEARSERAAVMLTPDEKAAVRFVAAIRNLTESDLLRDCTIGEIVASHAAARAKLEGAA